MPRPEKWKPTPPKEKLSQMLDYNPDTGVLTWKSRAPESFTSNELTRGLMAMRWNAMFSGKEAGSTSRDGFYRKVTIEGEAYLAHRLIWKMVHDDEPADIDHINGDKNDNRLSNLRSVTHGVNMRNKSMYVNNQSGTTGVEFHNRDAVWTAKIGSGNKQIYLGSFQTKDEAIACRIGAEVILAYHANHGRHKNEE